MALSVSIHLVTAVGRLKEPPVPNPPVIYFKSSAAFFESQCDFGYTRIEVGVAVVALVLDAQKEFGTPTPVSIGKGGIQLAALKVASEDGGFLVFSQTPSGSGDR